MYHFDAVSEQKNSSLVSEPFSIFKMIRFIFYLYWFLRTSLKGDVSFKTRKILTQE